MQYPVVCRGALRHGEHGVIAELRRSGSPARRQLHRWTQSGENEVVEEVPERPADPSTTQPKERIMQRTACNEDEAMLPGRSMGNPMEVVR